MIYASCINLYSWHILKGSDLDEEARDKGQYKLSFNGYNNNSFNGLDSDVLITSFDELHRKV